MNNYALPGSGLFYFSDMKLSRFISIFLSLQCGTMIIQGNIDFNALTLISTLKLIGTCLR